MRSRQTAQVRPGNGRRAEARLAAHPRDPGLTRRRPNFKTSPKNGQVGFCRALGDELERLSSRFRRSWCRFARNEVLDRAGDGDSPLPIGRKTLSSPFFLQASSGSLTTRGARRLPGRIFWIRVSPSPLIARDFRGPTAPWVSGRRGDGVRNQGGVHAIRHADGPPAPRISPPASDGLTSRRFTRTDNAMRTSTR